MISSCPFESYTSYGVLKKMRSVVKEIYPDLLQRRIFLQKFLKYPQFLLCRYTHCKFGTAMASGATNWDQQAAFSSALAFQAENNAQNQRPVLQRGTSLEERPARYLMRTGICVGQGNPSFYEVRREEIHRDDGSRTVRLALPSSSNESESNEKVILLLGATGTGKTPKMIKFSKISKKICKTCHLDDVLDLQGKALW